MGKFGQNLERTIQAVDNLKQVFKSNLGIGDTALLLTENSLYRIRKIEDQLYEVSGGWFDLNGLSPMVLPIRGCTWGGSMIKVDIVAACGLCLEFGNNLTTSRIRKIILFPASALN